MRRRDSGQASLEVVATIPLVVLALAVVWQVCAVARAGILVREDARAAAIRATGSGLVVVRRERLVGSVIPGVPRIRVRASATTIAP